MTYSDEETKKAFDILMNGECDSVNCSNAGTEEHRCPYRSEILNDDNLCNCCKACMDLCRDAV